MCSLYNIRVDRLGVFLDLFSKLVDHFEGGFTMDGSEDILIKEVFRVTNGARQGGLQ